MSDDHYKITKRLLRIMRRAEESIDQLGINALTTIDLFIAFQNEKNGALGEVASKVNVDLEKIATKREVELEQVNNYNLFNEKVSSEVLTVFEAACEYMRRYNQVFLNEGHVLKALIKESSVINQHVSDEDKKLLLTLGTSSRDMITYLGEYQFPAIRDLNIQSVELVDQHDLVMFVRNEFSQEWSNTIEQGLSMNQKSIYVAYDDFGQLIGFAAYDVFKGKKGYIGPIGVTSSNRTSGVGYALLHYCLRDMKEIGYAYAVIGGAGPIEFFEKACRAVVIPSTYTTNEV
ncbi:GNAT family N-acetyltransferase [Alkalibacillus haloalkaliphilus]|uniref:GNAT family N-acetyltransferase n=1 Tax=Alkalibacillus haloalkaliphilus TaxID=94136 RepID=UPI0002F24222|nr:GNAT family N-acetyltransferase [Alkalibacillus haloalkaliphilus]